MLFGDLLHKSDQDSVIILLDKERFPTGGPLGDMGYEFRAVQFPRGPEIAPDLTLRNEVQRIHSNSLYLLRKAGRSIMSMGTESNVG
jgi:hypothetical protein